MAENNPNRDAPKNILSKKPWNGLSVDSLNFLHQLPLFKNLPEKNLAFISQHFKLEHYECNDIILYEGTIADTFIIIRSGLVEISKNSGSHFIRYMEQQDFFGEIGLLTGQTRIATVTALTPVDILVLDKEDFYAMLSQNVEITIALARELAYRLFDTDQRMVNKLEGSNLILVISTKECLGASTVANAMALIFASLSQTPTAYAEFPKKDLAPAYGFAPSIERYDHAGGFQILNPELGPDISDWAQISFVIDQATTQFKNIVLCISAELAQQLVALVHNASQIVMVTSSKQEDWQQAQRAIASLEQHIHPHKTRFYTIVNHLHPAASDELINATPDFVIPFLDSLLPIADRRVENLPQPLTAIVTEMHHRLGFANQIGIYLPTTVDVNQKTDTSAFVKETLSFMGKLFGGATHEIVKGLWNSQEVGLVEETIHLIRSNCSQSDLNQHMREVINHVEALKQDLHQEAMALEVNHKLMLI